MSETDRQEKQGESSLVTAEHSLRFQLPETEELDLFVVMLEDGTKVVRTAAELEEMGLWPGSEQVEEA